MKMLAKTQLLKIAHPPRLAADLPRSATVRLCRFVGLNVYEITNYKSQITNKFQIPNFKVQNKRKSDGFL